MATRGRKPTPPRAAKGIGTAARDWGCPAHLTGVAAEAWAHMVGLLADNGNLDRADPEVVASYAEAVAMRKAAFAEVEKRGPLVETVVLDKEGNEVATSLKANPACAIANAATMRIKSIAESLGLMPATSKYGADKGQANPGSDKWGGMLEVVG
jgi:P27 family predicted phage terminase small subunit